MSAKTMPKSEAQKTCICGSCPSYVKCGEAWAYCLIESGKSKCITVEQGCVCPACPVQMELSYTNEYYCTKGSNKALVGEVI
jgi:hypothetical protein